MSDQNDPKISARKDTTNRITDFDGNVILEIGQQEYTVRHADKSITHHSINENIRLVCGTIWNALMMAKVFIGICQQCREPSLFNGGTHGIVAMNRAKLCVDCGTLCCPGHRKQGRDKMWRCLRHHKTHLLKSLCRPIFFDRKEE